jgi:hypothetical protein
VGATPIIRSTLLCGAARAPSPNDRRGMIGRSR